MIFGLWAPESLKLYTHPPRRLCACVWGSFVLVAAQQCGGSRKCGCCIELCEPGP